MAINVYQINGTYYRADTGARVLNRNDLKALTKAGGKLVPAPTEAPASKPQVPPTPAPVQKPAAPPASVPLNTAVRQATLYGPGGSPVRVDVGSSGAAHLQSLGYGLSPGSYKAPAPTPVVPSTLAPTVSKPQTVPDGPPAPNGSLTPDGSQTGAGNLPQGSAFTGQHLIKFSSMPGDASEGNTSTVFLVDADNHSLRPFMSMDALTNYYRAKGIDPQSALSSISTVDPQELTDHTGALSGFKVLDHNYGIQNDGSVSNANFSPATLKSYYGKTPDDSTTQTAVKYLSAIKLQMNGMISDGTLKGVTQQNLDSVFSDQGQLARLINAIGYGGYDAKDITMEATRLALVKGGNTSLANSSIISDSQTKDVYSQTQGYKLTAGNPSIALPQNAADRIMSQTTDPAYFSNPTGSIQDMMKDPNFKNNLDQLKSTFSDIVNQQLTASTDRERQMAQYNWDNYRKVVGTRLGIALSASATDAWDQISNLDKQAAGQGLMGSGIHNEMVDNYLKKVRFSDQSQRISKLTQEEAAKASYYTSSASPDQIKALIAADQASGKPQAEWDSVKWGLMPGDDMKSKFDVNTLYNQLKQDYADKNLPDWYLQQKAQNLHDAALDENGNLRSSLYSNYVSSTQANNESALQNKVANTLQQSVNSNDKFFSNFTNPAPGDPNYFSGQTPSTLSQTASTLNQNPAPASASPQTPAAPSSISSPGSLNDLQASAPAGYTVNSAGQLSQAANAASNISSSLSGDKTKMPTGPGSGSSNPAPTTMTLPSGQKVSSLDDTYKSMFASQLGK